MKKLIFTVLLFLFASFSSAIADGRTPEQIVEETSSEVLEVINRDAERIKNEPGYVNTLIDDLIIPVVDLQSMGKLILGKHWKTASPEQQTRFISEFKSMLIRTYAKSITNYGDAKVTVLPNNKPQGRFYSVNTELDLGSGTPLTVAYVFREVAESWKIIDLSVDGLSLVKNFRTSFTHEISETSLDALIERLANTNTEKDITEPVS